MIWRVRLEDLSGLSTLVREILPDRSTAVPLDCLLDPSYFAIMSEEAFLLARLDMWNGQRVVFILSAGARKSVSQYIRNEMNAWLEHWAREQGASRILAFTRTPEVFLKRHGYQLESFVISRAVPTS